MVIIKITLTWIILMILFFLFVKACFKDGE